MVWYPIFWPTKPSALVNQAGTSGLEVHWHAIGSKSSQTMKGCGVIVDAKTFDSLVPHARAIEELARHMGGRPFLRPPQGEVAGPVLSARTPPLRTDVGTSTPYSTGNKPTGHPSLQEIIRFLNARQTRATYGAVAAVLGIPAIAIGARLGPRRSEVSWIVSASTELPTGYARAELHPALLRTSDIIRSGSELLSRLTAWREAS